MPRNDPLGDRMKDRYEKRARSFLPRRTYTILRLDGKAFHTYTRGLDKPFDMQFMEDMSLTAKYLVENISGAQVAYAQSDEISIVLTDFGSTRTEAWFDGSVQKMVSVSASMATARFNELRPGKLAFFDSRVFTIPDVVEVHNYLVWRQQDAMTNAVSMAAQAKFSQKALHGKSTAQMQEMLFQDAGIDFNDYPARIKRGSMITPVIEASDISYYSEGETIIAKGVPRRSWATFAPPVLTRNPDFLKEIIPTHGYEIA